ncbi:MAG: phosphonate metabolism transcriptional regulator PhnF [Hyphomicrobiales bacterium]|nr:MAG: phosphonate metabolism transcriptional regulator PhnF [Hyphomicrobiales bacterium]
MAKTTAPHETGAALPLWRRLEAQIRQLILDGVHAPGAQLPSDREIAATLGASRMTTRRALAALEQEGLLRIEHGSGTFVSEDALVRYRLGQDRVRFGQNFIALDGQTAQRRQILNTEQIAASGEVARRLGLADGAPVLAIRMLALAGETPISVGTRYCDAVRFAGLDTAFEKAGSFTAALAGYGVTDYRRAATDVIARMPTAEEARLLRQSRALPVLAYAATDVEVRAGTRPRRPRVISYHLGCFAAERAVITIAPDAV